MIVKSDKTLMIANPGVQVSSKWDGKHQGGAHIRDGVYWEACYIPDKEERRIQMALLDKRYPNTQLRSSSAVFNTKSART